jgi:CubicO group peptidase (beta-lactamase class C family)
MQELRRKTGMNKPRSLLARALRVLVIGVSVGALNVGLGQSAWGRSAVLPSTRAGQLVGEWVKLCRTPDLAQMTKWLTANLSEEAAKRVPAKDRAQDDFALCAANGGFDVVQVTTSEPNRISLILIGLNSGVWFDRGLTVDSAGKLERAGLYPTSPPESALPKDLSDAAIASEVKSTVARLSRMGLFSGIVTVARATGTIVTASGGYADRAKKTAITGSSQFTLGSMGKMFTAASIGQLVDQKKMSFDDTVGKFFPDYPNHAVRDKVTVAMLLSHTAGMGDFLDKRTPEMMTHGVKRAAEFMPLYDRDEPLFAPGTDWEYSNAGLSLAGAIVEEVSGEDYPDYIRKHIFAVAGMTNSDPNNIPDLTANLVTPYTKETRYGPSPDWHEAEHDIGSPAGGAISTSDDLVRFAAALRGGKLVSNATFEEMTKSRGTKPPRLNYGYAMEIEHVYGRTIVGHGGGFPGVSTHLYLVLGSPYTVVVLANEDPPAEAYAGSKVVALMAEKAKLEK